jgi:hypothetical protein
MTCSPKYPISLTTEQGLNIIVDSPIIGTASQFIPHAVDTNLHADFVQFVHDVPQGMLSSAKFQITQELMTLMRVPVDPDEYNQYSLLKLPHNAPTNKRNQKVCALIRHESAFTNSCALCALMLVFKNLEGVDKVQLIMLPDSSCKLIESSDLSKNVLKTNPWNRVLNRLKIAPSEIVHDSHAILQAKQEASLLAAGYNIQLEQPDQNKQRLSHMSLTLVTDLANTTLTVCKKHLRETTNRLLQRYVTSCKQIGASAVVGIQETIVVSDEHYIQMEIEHIGRMFCSLRAVQDDRFIASTTVNFAKQMVFATIMGPQYTNLFGLQKIALLTATKMQSVLTPEFLSTFVISNDAATKNMMTLMLSNDLYDEIRNVNPYVLKRVTDFVLTEHVSYENTMQVQEHMFQNSTLYSQKRLRASITAPTSQKADRSAWLGLTDKFSIQKMVAARGVATAQLFCKNEELPVSDDVYAHFSNLSTARIIHQSTYEETVDKRTYMMWHGPSDNGEPQPLSSVMTRSNPQFFFTQSQTPQKRDLRVYRQHEGINALIAEFKDDETLKHVTASKDVDRGGPLICALLDACGDDHSSLYQTALINLVFRTMLQHESQELNCASWLQHFRGQWLLNHYQAVPVGEIEANKLYLEYSLFSECLKRNVQGLQIPADVFSVVAQEVLPFPCV